MEIQVGILCIVVVVVIGTVIAILEYNVIKKRTNATAFEGG